ncbi:hypothetical protein H9Q10_04030 [Eikenella sp. S3360]|uniref:SMI1/KNR4 family protein n=1 Tax=Eikenella glucosivorans TaxID=2766967 RepID=A0ABS0N959_9NEIS|nr:hypothetical protein [Eikenella glucosivorans]MBH5328834.1 hypothetical protein [Eikenella glucosivorans]
MEPVELQDIPNEVFLEDIQDLTQAFPREFPHLFQQIKDYLGIAEKHIYITDFVEDQNQEDSFYGYFFDALNRKIYHYAFEGEKTAFHEADMAALTMRDTFSIKVLHLLA